MHPHPIHPTPPLPFRCSRLTLVRTAWLGLGPRCRSCMLYPDRLPPTPELTASHRSLLAQCLGTRAEAAAPLQPLRLLVVDRQYESGR